MRPPGARSIRSRLAAISSNLERVSRNQRSKICSADIGDGITCFSRTIDETLIVCSRCFIVSRSGKPPRRIDLDGSRRILTLAWNEDGGFVSLSPSVKKLAEEFAKLPGIGPKSAERLTQYILQ